MGLAQLVGTMHCNIQGTEFELLEQNVFNIATLSFDDNKILKVQ